MNLFTIDEDNNITAFAGAKEAAQAGDATATTFDSAAALAKISAGWPLSRFVEIWNSVPGNTAVKKFADRKKAVLRIWNAIQPLAVDGQPSDAPAKPEKPTESAKATKKAKVTTRTSAARKDVGQGERSNKKAEVIAMMKRAKGVTLAQIMETTGWQAHTVRGFVSLLGSKGGERITSSRSSAGERTYHIAK
jgi:hypothetical protein